MKKIILLIFILCFFKVNSQNKNILLNYSFTIKDFSKNIDKSDPLRYYFKDKIKTYNQISNSLFIRVQSNKLDSNVFFNDLLLPENIPSSELIALKSLVLPFSPILHKDDGVYAGNSLIKNFIKFDVDNILDWKITDDTKKIKGYLCIKAKPININPMFKKNFSLIPTFIWFCPDLNFKASPSLFSNLPGAILEINYKNFDIYIDKINTGDEVFIDNDLSNKKIISYSQFKSLIAKK